MNSIIGFSDNPNFRAFWYGTNKLFANAIFFGDYASAESSHLSTTHSTYATSTASATVRAISSPPSSSGSGLW